MIRSGRESNYEIGKDTGRFWDAGAANVHWVIVNDDQVEQGITEALSRVRAAGVIVEGNSFLEYVTADVTIMCARSEGGKLKSSARRVLPRIDFMYLSSLEGSAASAKQQFQEFSHSLKLPLDQCAIITRDDIPTLLLPALVPSPQADFQLHCV